MDAYDIVDSLPTGYRWATMDETEDWTNLSNKMIQVRVGGPDDEPWTDLAITVTKPLSR